MHPPAASPPAPTPVVVPMARPHRWRGRGWTAGLVAGLAITLTASLSLGVVCVAIRDVLLEDLRDYLRRTAETMAAQIDGDRHARFTDSSQTDTPEYLAASAPLAALLRANPDIHFAYTGVVRGDSMFFVLDGDRTADRAWVMQLDAPTAGELEVARRRQTVVERKPSPTAWGVGIRAYAPLGGRAASAGAYVGITMSAERFNHWVSRVYRTAALGFLVAVALAVVAGVRVARVEHTRLQAEAEMRAAEELAAAAAAERQALEARSQSRQKLEALGTLAGGVAHDFNNMLAVIMGNAELIVAETASESFTHGSAEAIRTAAVRARDVVRRILLFSRPEVETRTPVALGAVIEETVQLLSATLPSSIRLLWQRPTRPVIATGDASQLSQVLMNLGVNASQAMPEGRGTIEFRLERVELGPVEGHGLGLQSGPYAQIAVCDDGMGMSEEVRGRIFEPFFTTKAVGKGSGLGLSVVEGVVRGHGGAIEVESAIGKGTTFRLYLPASEPVPADPGSTPRPPARAPEGSGQRILLLDDDPMVLAVEAKVLGRAGYVVSAYDDVDLALGALAAEPQGFAVLVTDRTMPKCSGLEVAGRARELSPGLPILLLTGKSEPGDAESPHVTVVVGKPADAPTLLGAIQRATSRRAAAAALAPAIPAAR